MYSLRVSLPPPPHPALKKKFGCAYDSGGKVDIFEGDSVSHCDKKVCMNMCVITNC